MTNGSPQRVEQPPPASVWQKVVAVLMLFLPKQVQEAYRLGLLPVLAVLAATIFVLPPLVVGLAALSLRTLGSLDWDWTNAIRRSYLSFVYHGFDIEELAKSQAEKQNVRLDYFQIIEFDIKPARPHADRYSLRPGQHALLEIKSVQLYAPPDKPTCKLPADKNQYLVRVKLNDALLKELKEFDDDRDPRIAEIGDQFWKENSDKFKSNTAARDVALSFEPTDFVNKQCGLVSVKGSLTVYKDFMTLEK